MTRRSFANILAVSFMAALPACSDAEPEERPCSSANDAFVEGCEPVLPACGAEERLAETYRGTFGSLADDGTCQTDWPEPLLAECTEPLPGAVPNLRGLWTSAIHSERIEQCGNLVLIEGRNFVHGGFATGVPEDGVNDFRADSDCTQPIQVALSYVGSELRFMLGELVPVTRRLEVAADGVDELVWNFDIGIATGTGTSTGLTERARMRRVCDISELETN